MLRATVPFTLAGLRALHVPFTFSPEKLPINVQLVSEWFDVATILVLGQLIESATGAHNRRPIL
jgi:Asp-tRNA(Asn)/Glu-tRNA(Gln) amidotransferase A subunit family amidase